MINIKKNNESLIKSLLIESIKLISSDKKINVWDNYKINKIVYILSDIITISNFDSNNIKKRNILLDALKELKNETKTDFSSFKKCIDNKINKQKKEKFKEFKIIFLINLKKSNSKFLEEINIDNDKLKILESKWLYDHILNNNKIDINCNKDELLNYINTFTWIEISVFGNDKFDIFNKGLLKIESFRSIINFILIYGIISFIRINPAQKSYFSPSKYYFLFDNKYNFEYYRYSIGDYNYSIKDLSTANINAIKNFFNDINKIKKSSIKNLLIENIRLFNDAIDTYNKEYTFVILWSLIDLITNSYRENVDRLKLISCKDENDYYLIDALYNKRNDLVHKGKINDFEEEDVDLLIVYVKRLIYFIFKSSQYFENIDDISNIFKFLKINNDYKIFIKDYNNIYEFIEKNLKK